MTSTIGRYRIIRRLDGGSEAYLATGADGKRATLRLHSLQPEDDQWHDAQVQAGICGKIDHPAVCRVVELFHEGGKIVEAYETPAEGVTLAELIARLESEGLTLDPAAAWHLGHGLAAALSAALASGSDEDDLVTVFHGHLSPARVHISWTGEVQVSGFGLGPLVGGQAGIKADPQYAPPEGKPTPRGDVWALAACVWAGLAGKGPSGDLAFDVIIASLPPRLANPLHRACLRSLAERKVTSIELEHAFSEVSHDGQRKLAHAVNMLRQAVATGAAVPVRATLPHGAATPQKPLGARPGGTLGSGGALGTPASRRGAALGGKAPAPMRPKQSTIMGQGPEHAADPPSRGKLHSAPPIDWGAAKQSAQSKAPVEEDLTWGDAEDDDVPTRIAQRPDVTRAATIAAAHRQGGGDDLDTTRVALRPKLPTEAQIEQRRRELAHAAKSNEAVTASAVIDVAGNYDPASNRTGTTPASPGVGAPDDAAAAPPATTRMDADSIEDDFASALEDTADSLADMPRPGDPQAAAQSGAATSGGASAVAPVADMLDQMLDEIAPAGSNAPPGGFPGSQPLPGSVPGSGPAAAASAGFPPSGAGAPSGPLAPPGFPPSGAALSPPVGPAFSPVAGAQPGAGLGATVPSPTTSSAWAGRADASPTADKASAEPISMLAAAAITIGTAVAVMVVGVAWVRTTQTIGTASPPSAEPSASAAPSASEAEAPETSVTASVSDAPPSTTATASATVAEDDGKLLPRNKGYLLVRFAGNAQAEVFLFGKSYGKVNTKLEVPCERPAFVRVGAGPARWLTEGDSVQLRCQGLTEVTLAPSE